MSWYIACQKPAIEPREISFPFSVGRGVCNLRISNRSLSRRQFELKEKAGSLFLENLSMSNPTCVDGEEVLGVLELDPSTTHIISVGSLQLALSTRSDLMDAFEQAGSDASSFCYQTDGSVYGPCSLDELGTAFEEGTLRADSMVWEFGKEDQAKPASELFDMDDSSAGGPSTADSFPDPMENSFGPPSRHLTSEEAEAVPGESFLCPFCRTVSGLEDVLSVSVSASLMGDPILGPSEQQRFLPSRFTQNGLAIDSEGGVCTEVACPRCHMSLPSAILQTPQIVMSVVGAAGAGKSVFLASSIWECRQLLSKYFGVSFMDLDPVANRWINDYEAKLFFQENDDELQQIEKTDLNSADVSKSVLLDGEPVQLSLPSFFSIRSKSFSEHSLVVYDSAGEHFRAGGDTASSLVTLNMLGADILFFLYDPSADPRFFRLLERGKGDAKNHAQRQDTVLAEMAARIRRHLGNRGEGRLSRPLLFGVSKADLLRSQLPLDTPIYSRLEDGRVVLDFDALRSVSTATEQFLDNIAPEVVATAHDIASEVWFVPISALGHNPMKAGVRPSDVSPIWAELPIVFTLAVRGLIPSVGNRVEKEN